MEKPSKSTNDGTPGDASSTTRNTPNNSAIRELILTEPEVIPCWEMFNEKYYRNFRKDWFHYVQDNGFKSIQDLATMACKFQSANFL